MRKRLKKSLKNYTKLIKKFNSKSFYEEFAPSFSIFLRFFLSYPIGRASSLERVLPPRYDSEIKSLELILISGAARISVRGGGNILGGRPRRGSGGGAPRTPENFEIFQKIVKKIAKNGLF